MTSPRKPRPWHPPGDPAGSSSGTTAGGRPAPNSHSVATLAAILAALSWLGAVYGGWLMVLGRDTIEGMLSFVGLLWLGVFATVALGLTAVAALALRRRGSPRAALVAGVVAVAGILATVLFLRWV
ncbi:hypothetical protein [Micromonospora sp. NPDC023633]|uniref:hypothetical protein n=1 Tax=Micromonospora sp. NPDC023633 TaxID=3154320 RepID=UPI0033E29811